MRYHKLYFDYCRAAYRAVPGERAIDSKINDSRLASIDKIFKRNALVLGCIMLEELQAKNYANQDIHIKVIFDLRNAIIHTRCSLDELQDRSAPERIRDYIENERYKDLVGKPYFTLDTENNTVEINDCESVVRQLLQRYDRN